MCDLAALRAIVYGRVQGVYFRAFTSKHATELGLTGYVRNLPDGRGVEVQAEGEKDRLEKLIGRLEVGPPAAQVTEVVTDWTEYRGSYTGFSIRY